MPRAENLAKRTPTTRDVFNRFGAYLLDEDRCREMVISKLHPAPCCPDCAAKLTWTQDAAFRQNKRVRCNQCGRFFTALSGSPLSGMHMDFRAFVLLCFCLEAGLNNTQISMLIGDTTDTVRAWRRKLALLQIIQTIE